MIPTKQQFQDLTAACDSNGLSSSLNLIFANATESQIRGIIKGCDDALNTAFLNHINPLPAYKWLSRQTPFLIAQTKAFPEVDKHWLDTQAAWVMMHTEKFLEANTPLAGDRKTIMRGFMKQVMFKMQARLYWVGLVAKCLSSYHYPNTPEIRKMREKLLAAGQKFIETRQAIDELAAYSDYMPWLPLPDNDFSYKLDMFSNLLQPENVKNLTPIQRADASFMERLFITQLADGHALYLQRDDGMPAVIADLFYLEGFHNPLEERSIRRICADQQKRREAAMHIAAEARSYAGQQKSSSGQLTAKN